MLSRRPAGNQLGIPLDYSLCNQVVTVYHQVNVGNYIRTVYPQAFLDFKRVQNVDKVGTKESSSFLLVLPGEPSIAVGDKVLLGEGPLVQTREEWAALIPAKVSGLVVVQWVDCKYWQGRCCHVEAGG